MKKRIFEIVQNAKDGDKASKFFDIFIIVLIIVNSIVVVADTFQLPEIAKQISRWIEIISVIIFTIEYICRLWTADLLHSDLSAAKARIRYIFSFMAIIDLLAILPFYLPMIIPIDLRVLRMLRIFRLFRIFKINRYTNALSTIGQVIKDKAAQLISSMFVVFLLILIASILMYSVEHEAQPEQFNNIFQSMWWAIATLTTVGYGDIYPITVAGKILSAIIALLGIGMVAVPTGIISSGFSEMIDKQKVDDDKKYCPYCGHKLE